MPFRSKKSRMASWFIAPYEGLYNRVCRRVKSSILLILVALM